MIRKKIIIFVFIICFVYMSCKGNEKSMYFSFKEIQDVFYQKIKALDSTNLSPFYIYEDYLKNIEQELNELIKKSDFCSVLICVDIDNGIYDIRALYDYKDEIYFSVWEYNGFQKQTKIQEPDVKKILKAEPKKEIIIDDSGLLISDSTSEYIIKKIKNKTYYYANCEESIDVDYTHWLIYLENLVKI